MAEHPFVVYTVEESLRNQASSCTEVGSPLYGVLLEGLLADHRRGGITARLLDGVTETPHHDALPLRYLATGHLLALNGSAPQLARHYPSCGGSWDGSATVVDDFLATAVEHEAEFRIGVRRNVQTNEVGRAAVLASGFSLIAERHALPIDQLEIGSSAGLLSRWNHYWYETGESSTGTAGSRLVFGPEWWVSSAKPLLLTVDIARMRASDINPIDARSPEGRQTMLSFVWPDQVSRIDRLRSAFDLAADAPLAIDRSDAGTWLARELTDGPTVGAATVVFHSIVWQYLPRWTKDRVRQVIASAGDVAGPESPLLWLRMEPLDRDQAAVRLTTWPGQTDEVIARVGYHGADIEWLAAETC